MSADPSRWSHCSAVPPGLSRFFHTADIRPSSSRRPTFPLPAATAIATAMSPSLFSDSDSNSPTQSLPSLSDAESDAGSDSGRSSTSSEYIAPLSGHAPDPSIDGTSVGGGEGGVRADREEDVGDEEKQVSQSLESAVRWCEGMGALVHKK